MQSRSLPKALSEDSLRQSTAPRLTTITYLEVVSKTEWNLESQYSFELTYSLLLPSTLKGTRLVIHDPFYSRR